MIWPRTPIAEIDISHASQGKQYLGVQSAFVAESIAGLVPRVAIGLSFDNDVFRIVVRSFDTQLFAQKEACATRRTRIGVIVACKNPPRHSIRLQTKRLRRSSYFRNDVVLFRWLLQLLARNAGHSCASFRNGKRESSISRMAILWKLRLQPPHNLQLDFVPRKPPR